MLPDLPYSASRSFKGTGIIASVICAANRAVDDFLWKWGVIWPP